MITTIESALAFVEAVFGRLEPGDAVEESAMVSAEARLGVKLPHALRMLYRASGASQALHHAHNQLLAPAKVDFAANHLVFYEENQGVVVWGIARDRLAEMDPPVEQGQLDSRTGEWTFYPEFGSVSEFVAAQCAWQAVQGGLAYVGSKVHGDASDEPVSVFEAGLGTAILVTASMRAWLVDGGVATKAGEMLGLATREPRQFEAASLRLGIAIDDWDYATISDE